MFFEQYLVLKFDKISFHFIKQWFNLGQIELNSNFSQDPGDQVSLWKVNILCRHVFDIVVVPQNSVHESPELTSVDDLLEPCFSVLTWEKDLPSVIACIPGVGFDPKTLRLITVFDRDFFLLVIVLFFDFLVKQYSLFEVE